VNPVAEGKCQIADPCIQCSSGMGHPPMVSIYDPAEGGYFLQEEAEEFTCIARHDSNGYGYAEGGICGMPTQKWVGDVPLCGVHWKRLMEDVAQTREEAYDARLARDAELHEQQMRHAEELNRKHIELDRKRIAAAAKAKSPYSVVYYIRRESDGAVKIGFTANTRNRMSALRLEHGQLRVLLVLGGGRHEETAAHSLFRRYRIGRTEWFRPVRPLLEWIREAREGHTYPGIQPDDILPMDELGLLVLAAVPSEVLQWDDDGVLQWPPGEAAA
jgi:hypothetical protein